MLSPQSLIVIVTPLTPVLIPLQTLDQVLRRLQTAAMQGDAATRGCTAYSQPRVAGQWPCKATWTRTGPDTQQRGHARGRPRVCRHTNWAHSRPIVALEITCNVAFTAAAVAAVLASSAEESPVRPLVLDERLDSWCR